MREVIITRDALEFILQASRSTYPEEFAGLLRKNGEGIISEILVIPQTIYGKGHSSINLYNIPYTARHCGSVHSHPTPDARPSRADIAFFKNTGEVHLIVAYPYTPQSICAYDSEGKRLVIKIA